jgi:hypothetical protein
VNLGLRFDFNGVPVDAKGLWRTLDLPGLGSNIKPAPPHIEPPGPQTSLTGRSGSNLFF